MWSCDHLCLTLVAPYPKAATNLQSCFGEEVGLNISQQFIINLQWELPEGNEFNIPMLHNMYIRMYWCFTIQVCFVVLLCASTQLLCSYNCD